MEETNLYTARVQVVEAMEQGLPLARGRQARWARDSVNRRPIGCVSACGKRANQRCVRVGMDIPSNCEARRGSFWKRPAAKRLTRQATRSKRSLPSALAYK
jgi:hypothetical protein